MGQEMYKMLQTEDLVFKSLLILFDWLRKWQNKKIWEIPFPQRNSLTTKNVEASSRYRKTSKKGYINHRKKLFRLAKMKFTYRVLLFCTICWAALSFFFTIELTCITAKSWKICIFIILLKFTAAASKTYSLYHS